VPYRLDIAAPRADTLDRLIDLGALDVDAQPGGSISAVMIDEVRPDQVAAALGTRLTVSAALGRDDDSVWLLRPRGLVVSGLSIAPADAPAAANTIRLHDTSAFGTGIHPTTQLCLEALLDIVRRERPTTGLDVGTGSGVLALAALAGGVRRAHGLDLDPVALEAAAANRRLNGHERALTLSQGGPESLRGRWPLVVANIVTGPLIELAPALVRLVGHAGHIVLSGFPDGVAADVAGRYQRLGLHPVRHLSRGGWAALVLRSSW
jgi:ribosomal protein L11 methylase PrmA